VFAFFAVTTVTKFSSDGSILYQFGHKLGGPGRTHHADKPTKS
jgi:hypothetical protein